MAKRKRSKGKRSSQPGKARTGSRAVATRRFVEPISPLAEKSDALTPAPALPSERGRRGRVALAGHSTLGDVQPNLGDVQPMVIPQPAPRSEGPDPSQTPSQSQIYERLAALLVPYAPKMESEMHPKIGFCLKAKSARTGRETHFGAVQIVPDGVAFHLFPLYAHPELLDDISPALFNCMRGKTCFHFDALDDAIVSELNELTRQGFERFLADGVF